jgi:hypothetical protein
METQKEINAKASPLLSEARLNKDYGHLRPLCGNFSCFKTQIYVFLGVVVRFWGRGLFNNCIVVRSAKRKNGATLIDENADKLAQEHIWAWGHPFFENRPRSKRFSEDKESENRVTFEDFYKVENDVSINDFLIELPYS